MAVMLALALIVRGGVRHVNRAAPIFLSVVILSIILLLLGIFLFAGGAYKGALSWSDRDFGDNVEPDFEKTDACFGVEIQPYAVDATSTGVVSARRRRGWFLCRL